MSEGTKGRFDRTNRFFWIVICIVMTVASGLLFSTMPVIGCLEDALTASYCETPAGRMDMGLRCSLLSLIFAVVPALLIYFLGRMSLTGIANPEKSERAFRGAATVWAVSVFCACLGGLWFACQLRPPL